MIFTVSCVLTATLTLVHAGPSPNLGLSQNEICRKDGDIEWRCRRAEDCPHNQVVDVGGRTVCGYSDDKPLVCCPHLRAKRATEAIKRGSKARAYCQKCLSYFCSQRKFDWSVDENTESSLLADRLISGGFNALRERFPEMALIGFGDKKSKSWLCGGTLISERYVLSAAHCVKQYIMGDAKWIRLGDLDHSVDDDIAEPQDYRIEEAIPHPQYQGPQMYHDIALFKLDREVRFTKFVRPVCLHTSPTVPFERVTATGWGRTGFVSEFSTLLLAVDLFMVNHTVCSDLRKTSARIPHGVEYRTMICAGSLTGEKDTCQGDSGGPLVVKYGGRCLSTQVGVTSFGDMCALPNSPAVYTRVSHYIPWIESIVWP